MACRVGGEDAALDNMNTEPNKVSKRAGLINIGIEMQRRNCRSIAVSRSRRKNFNPEIFFGWLAKQQGLAERLVVC